MEPSHGPSSIVSYGYGHIRVILESIGAKLAEFATWGRAIRMNWTFDRLRKHGMPERWPLLHVSFGHFWEGRFPKNGSTRPGTFGQATATTQSSAKRRRNDIGDPRGVFCWHGARPLLVCLRRPTAANRVERLNARNFRSERYAANDFALIVPFGCCFETPRRMAMFAIWLS